MLLHLHVNVVGAVLVAQSRVSFRGFSPYPCGVNRWPIVKFYHPLPYLCSAKGLLIYPWVLLDGEDMKAARGLCAAFLVARELGPIVFYGLIISEALQARLGAGHPRVLPYIARLASLPAG